MSHEALVRFSEALAEQDRAYADQAPVRFMERQQRRSWRGSRTARAEVKAKRLGLLRPRG